MAAVGSKPRGTRAALSKHTPFLFSHPRKNERMQMNRGEERVEPRLSLHRGVNLFFPPSSDTLLPSFLESERAQRGKSGRRKKKRGGAEEPALPRERRTELKHARHTWQIKAGRFYLHTAERRRYTNKLCTASRSKTRERKHAVSKRDKVREWKIPRRGENRSRPPPS